MKDNFIKSFEWEILDERIQVDKLKTEACKFDDGSQINVWRDDDFIICAELEGKISSDEKNDAPIGSIIPTFDIAGKYHSIMGATLSHCYFNSLVYDTPSHFFEVPDKESASVHGFIIESPKEKEREYFIERFLNGTKDIFMFPQNIRTLKNQERKREYIFDSGKSRKTENYNPWGSSATRSCVLIELAEFQFLIRPIPDAFTPNWSNALAIEYRTEWGGIPDEEIRNKIDTFVSFCLGRRLISIGHSILDKDGGIVIQECKNPNSNNLKSERRSSSNYPIEINNHKDMNSFKKLAEEKLPIFIEYSKHINFRQAIFNVFYANNTFLGFDLTVIVTAIETILKGWFMSKGSKSKGVYIKYKEYQKIIKEGLCFIEEALDVSEFCEHKDKLIRKIQNTNQFGVADKHKYFFEEIGLPVGEAEMMIFSQRNSDSHGDSKENESEDMIKGIYWRKVGITLFNRIVLKILDYDGKYIDYAQIGQPEKNIDEPICFIKKYE